MIYLGHTLVRKKFESREKYFINPIRIAFYNIFQNLTSDETKYLMKRNKLELKNGFKRMETAVLCLSKNVYEHLLLKKIIAQIDDANDKPKIAKLKRNTMILTEDTLELKRGQCLILNQENYKTSSFEKRHGTKEDKIYLAKVCNIYFFIKYRLRNTLT